MYIHVYFLSCLNNVKNNFVTYIKPVKVLFLHLYKYTYILLCGYQNSQCLSLQSSTIQNPYSHILLHTWLAYQNTHYNKYKIYTFILYYDDFIFVHFAIDVNECLDNNGMCSHDCVNTEGSYYCECPTGYILGPNSHDCQGEYCCVFKCTLYSLDIGIVLNTVVING